MTRLRRDRQFVRPPHPAVARFTLHLSAELTRQLRPLVEAKLQDVGLDWPTLLVLRIVTAIPDISQDALSERTGVDRTSLSVLVRDLEYDGMLDRAPDPLDRRRWRSVATPSGAELAVQGAQVVAEVSRRRLRLLPVREQRRLDELLIRALGG